MHHTQRYEIPFCTPAAAQQLLRSVFSSVAATAAAAAPFGTGDSRRRRRRGYLDVYKKQFESYTIRRLLPRKHLSTYIILECKVGTRVRARAIELVFICVRMRVCVCL